MIHHGDREKTSSGRIHRKGDCYRDRSTSNDRPGLLESAFEECLCHEMHRRGLRFQRQVPLPVDYKGVSLDCGFRLDSGVEDSVILELKCVEHVLPVHEAQLLTYLRMTGKRVGSIIHFHVATLVRGGTVRKVL